jgi:hypothetical protein
VKKVSWRIGLVIVPLLMIISCGGKEKMDQGRVIAFDKDKRTITFIRDKKANTQYPDYTHLPPITYMLLKDFFGNEPELKVGLRMTLDSENNKVIIYDPASQNFQTIDYTVLDKKERIAIDNPLVFNTDNKKPKEFPIIDRERKMITVYSWRQRILTTFTLPEKYFDLPEYTWNAGDEVLVYYKEEGKALRLINITRIGFVKD